VAVESSAATLRRVERDLHDGTQAQLVAMAMNISRARSKLAAGDAEGADTLLDGANAAAKDALSELRDVVRSIHPPSLDRGLVDALATLTSRNSIPTELRTNIGERPSPGVETIAYFCVAELLNNARLHAQASRVVVDVIQHPGALVLRVWDDGVGGARVIVPADDARSGTGLAGLIERISTVDGRLSIESPPGGPTAITVTLPS
jgi:signal transduction histidine kinase